MSAVDWTGAIARLVALTGWPWAVAGRLTIPQVQALSKAWRTSPPLSQTMLVIEALLRSALGAEPREIPQDEPAPAPTPAGGTSPSEQFKDFMARFRAEGTAAL